MVMDEVVPASTSEFCHYPKEISVRDYKPANQPTIRPTQLMAVDRPGA